mgnify:CR=1 FL=1
MKVKRLPQHHWDLKKLSDCCYSISDGDHQPPPKVDIGVPFVTISNINSSNQFDFSNAMHVPQDYYDNLDEKRKARKGDILYSVVGSFGTPILIKRTVPFVFQRHIAILRPNNNIDSRFLYYTMLSRDFYAKADTVAIGAAQRTISLTSLRNISIEVPSLPIQHRIADILSAYDDLIENNRKQIALLEEAAQRLYREWFVDFRFPGHETAEWENGLPKGWRKVLLTDMADIQYGYAFNGALFNSEQKGMPIIRIRNIPKGTTEDYTTEIADNRYVVHNGDILVGMDGEFHINTWSGDDAYLVQRTLCIHPKYNEHKGYLLNAIYAPIKYYEKTITGATVGHLGKSHIDKIFILKVADDLYKPFAQILNNQQILKNYNRRLQIARDSLLPRLMSGELEVK